MFHALEASDVDLETIAGMASNGIAELMQVDTRLQFLRDELLAPGVVNGRRREMQTASENAAMDKLVLRGLRLLGPYFTLPAAHKVMEYLIRRFACVSPCRVLIESKRCSVCSLCVLLAMKARVLTAVVVMAV